MARGPVKRGSYGDWAIIDNPPIINGCGGCIHYQEDGSCSVLPVVAHSLGKYAYKHCKEYCRPEVIHQNNVIQNDCPYCVYVRATDTYICNQSESKRYSYECGTCDWYDNEYRHTAQKAGAPLITEQTTKNVKNGLDAKKTEFLENKQGQAKKTPPSDSCRKKIVQSQPCQRIPTVSLEKEIEALRNEYERKLKTLISEYEKRLDTLTIEHSMEIAQKESVLRTMDSQLSKQQNEIDQLRIENAEKQAEIMCLRKEMDGKAHIEHETREEIDRLRAENASLLDNTIRLRNDAESNQKRSKSLREWFRSYFERI